MPGTTRVPLLATTLKERSGRACPDMSRSAARCRRQLVALPHPGGWHLPRQPARPAGGHGGRAGAAVCRCANGRECGRARGPGRTGRVADHHLVPAWVRVPAGPCPGWTWTARIGLLPGRGYRLASDRGSPNHGSTLFSKQVRAQIRSPARVSTKRPVPGRVPVGVAR
jgi:hypothetical protein